MPLAAVSRKLRSNTRDNHQSCIAATFPELQTKMLMQDLVCSEEASGEIKSWKGYYAISHFSLLICFEDK